MRDIVNVAVLIVTFASFVTAHVTIAAGLLARKPRWRAPAAFVVAPLAPFWAWREHMRVRAVLWLGALVLYVGAMVVGQL